MMWAVSAWCVMMVLWVSPGQALTPQELHPIMQQIWNTYGNRIQGQFSMAVSIPLVRGQYQVQTVINTDTVTAVTNDVNAGRVYSGTYVVAAKPQERTTGAAGNQHSEYRVLTATKRLPAPQNRWANSVRELRGRDLLVFYTVNSPCTTTCTVPGHREGILNHITVMKDWRQFALVFRQAFVPQRGQGEADLNEQQLLTKRQRDENDRRTALGNLRDPLTHGGLHGLYYIYRCSATECYNCAGNQRSVLRRCVTLDGAAPEVIQRPPRVHVDEDGWISAGGRRN